MKTARITKNTDRLMQAMQELSNSMHVPVLNVIRHMKPVSDADAKQVARAAKNFHALSLLRFESETDKEALSEPIQHIKQIRQIAAIWMKVRSGAELESLIEEQNREDPNIWSDFFSDLEELLKFVANIDEDVEDTQSIGPYRVLLKTAPNTEWTPETMGRLDWILRQAVGLLNKAGLIRAAGGNITAYPTKTLPSSARAPSNVEAYYMKSMDDFHLSVGHEDERRGLRVFIHETGHRVYYKLLGSQGRKSWDEFYDGGKGTPDITNVVSAWDDFTRKVRGTPKEPYAHCIDLFHEHIEQTNPGLLTELEVLITELEIEDPINRFTGMPDLRKPQAYDQLLTRAPKAKVFLSPVTAYSATSASELFAEAFAHAIVLGPRRVPENVMNALKAAMPAMKVASLNEGEMAERIARRSLKAAESR